MQEFISKVYNFIEFNIDNTHKNNTLFLFGGESVLKHLNMSLISMRSASSKHVYSTFEEGQLRF